jgi:acyl-CoA synthetase (AMP-forming)/AMP-acid ligase II
MEKLMTRITAGMIEKFTKEGHWRNKTLCDYFKICMGKKPDQLAVVDREYRLTFRDLETLSNHLASSLAKLGISKGDVVSFELPSWYQAIVVNLALTKLGAVINPIIPIYKEREVTFILKQARSKAIIIPEVFRGYNYVEMLEKIRPDLPDLEIQIVSGIQIPQGMISLEELMKEDGSLPPLPPIDPNDVKLLLYTSGTTAEPKGVQHTHNTLVCEELNASSFWELKEEDVIFMPSPVTHITGYLYALELPFVLGCKVVLMDQWNPEEALEIIAKEKCTFTVGATPFLQGLVQAARVKNYDLRFLRFACGGAAIPPELIREAYHKVGLRAFRAYGSSEAPTVTLGVRPGGPLEKAAETDGFIFGHEVQILDFENRPLPYGEEGEIVTKGPEVFVGYRDPSLNEDSFDEGGWFHTGDLGRMIPGSYLEITGRKKDIIIRGGENISAKEIEDLLHMHPRIEVAAAVAMPDVKMGEKVCAYVKLREGEKLAFEELVKFLSGYKLAKQKLPERLEIIEEFPMTPSGKIKKNELRRDIAQKLGLPPVRI